MILFGFEGRRLALKIGIFYFIAIQFCRIWRPVETSLRRKPELINGVIFCLFTPLFIWAETAIVRDWPVYPVDWMKELWSEPLLTLTALYELIQTSWRLKLFVLAGIFGIFGVLVASHMIYRVKPHASRIFFFCYACALIYGTWLLWRTNQKHILIWVLFYAAVGYAVFSELSSKINSPFYRSRLKWWEGHPEKKYPVSVELRTKFGKWKGTPSNLNDSGGYFFFAEKPEIIRYVQLKLENGDSRMICRGELMSETRSGKGVGVSFTSRSRDERKLISDFFLNLDGKGFLNLEKDH